LARGKRHEDKSILITGCSTGIGLCLARGLRERGYRVIATTRKPADAAKLARSELEALPLDLDSSESIEQAVDEGQPGAVEDLTRDTLRSQFETNLFGTQELTNRILPIFRAQGCGRIIQISSMLGFVCLAYRGAYNASKYALEALSDTLRLELRGTGIYVSLIEPGPIQSDFRKNAYAAFKTNIRVDHSVHRHSYVALEKRLAEQTAEPPFTLPPEAVLRKVVHALEARRPKVRYRVTVPTHVFAILKRLLPSSWVDGLLLSSSGTGTRS
jgi:short-subunit dehydrogenase